MVDPEGRSYSLGDIIPGGLSPDLPLVKSGHRYGYPPLRERIVQSQEYNLPIDNVLVTLGTQMSNFLAFPHYDLDLPSWDLCIALLKEPYRTYLIRGICYGYENHVRFGFGPRTPTVRLKEGVKQIDRFISDCRAGRVAAG